MMHTYVPTTDLLQPIQTVADEQHNTQDFDQTSPLRVMLDAVPDTVLILDDKRQVVFVNEAGVSALGLESWQAALGEYLGELIGCIHAGESLGGCGTTKSCRTCGAAKAIVNSLRGSENGQECHIQLADGAMLYMRVWAKPLAIKGKAYTIFTIKDVQEEKHRQDLDGIFFHDILNVAGVVFGFAKLLEEDAENALPLAANLSHAAQRLIDEITTQRALLAAENGSLRPDFTDIEVSPFLHEISEQYERHLDRHIQVIEPANSASLINDSTLLGRVIGNMVKNAAEASKSSDVVTLSYTTTSREIVFAVHNQAYMPPAAQMQIFNRGFSTKDERRGLGTYSMKMLSEQYMKGRVWFESTPTEGTTFYAAYPLGQ
jgi:nitrogen-specific signal transduction histidine kinase